MNQQNNIIILFTFTESFKWHRNRFDGEQNENVGRQSTYILLFIYYRFQRTMYGTTDILYLANLFSLFALFTSIDIIFRFVSVQTLLA